MEGLGGGGGLEGARDRGTVIHFRNSMIDPNNQNYFSLDEQTPVVLPWWRVRKHQMRMLAGFGIMVGIGVIGYYAWQTYSLTHVDVAKVEQANTIIANAVASCAGDADPEACENTARSDAARATGQASVCSALVGEELVNCVSLIALDAESAAACAQLSGADEVQCTDNATLLAARKAKNYSMCSSITDAAIRASCQSQLLSAVVAAGECAKYGVSDDECSFSKRIQSVIAAGKPDGCAQFSGEQAASCADIFVSLDQDKDGLNLFDEAVLGTSDVNADTDGDGYTDGEEVESKHDPLK